jgi:hypothetical protein
MHPQKTLAVAVVAVYESTRAAWSSTVERPSRGKPMNNLQLADSLCAASSALRDARRLHVKSFGTLIPHVFMSDVLARVGCCLLAVPADAVADPNREIVAILESLEHGMMAGDRETRNVIAISFVGDGELEPFFGELRPMLGPKVRAQMQGK